MNHITIGVAGHVDHGKTALVKAITGIDTDRLKEEKERGMSIVLGFAYLELEGGVVDFIDVPGHERFIKTMIAGATGIDQLLLVVAANELVKPQTIEHLHLAGLLGVNRGMVVVSKSDLAPADDQPRIMRDLRSRLAGTFMDQASFVFASALSGEGIDDLKSRIGALLKQSGTPAAVDSRFFHLPVDRVFTIAGHGTVVTGTLRAGSVRVGQEVEVAPIGIRAQVRGLESHNRSAPLADPGWRTALNLKGIKKEQLSPGNTITVPGFLRPTRLVDATIEVLNTAALPIQRGAKVRMHYATSESSVRVFPLESECILPGQSSLAQIRLSELSFIIPHERFILRSLSPAATIGGGTVLDINPSRHSVPDAQTMSALRALASGNFRDVVMAKLSEAGDSGLSLERLARELGIPLTELEAAAPASRVVHLDNNTVILRDTLTRLAQGVTETVRRFHASNPTRRGIPSEDLRQRMPPSCTQVVFSAVLAQLKSSGTIGDTEGRVYAEGFDPARALPAKEQQVQREIESRFVNGALRPPNIDDVVLQNKRRHEVYRYMVDQGILVETYDSGSRKTVAFHRDAVELAAGCLRAALRGGKGMTVSEINSLLDISRKYSIPLLEHLDHIGVTRRQGDKRLLKS